LNQEASEGWWTPQQIQLVGDRSRKWVKRNFSPRNATIVEQEGMKVIRPASTEECVTDSVIENGWDHEHCALCWAKISLQKTDEEIGYSDGKDWVCEKCFQKYLVPRLVIP
jgi:hypothetical protein